MTEILLSGVRFDGDVPILADSTLLDRRLRSAATWLIRQPGFMEAYRLDEVPAHRYRFKIEAPCPLTTEQRKLLSDHATDRLCAEIERLLPEADDGPSLERYAEHLRTLIWQHGISLRPALARSRGRAWRSRRIVWLWPGPQTERDYARSLHELGHVLDPDADCPSAVAVKQWTGWYCWPRAEWAAWRWAKATALDWTADMQDELRRTLRSYLEYATADERREIGALIRGEWS